MVVLSAVPSLAMSSSTHDCLVVVAAAVVAVVVYTCMHALSIIVE
jgi:hypothetical protein